MATGSTCCTIDVEPKIWDLSGTMTTEFYNKTDPTEPCGMVHEDQALIVKVTVVLKGNILHYLCDTQLCVCLAFESCGSGREGEICKYIKLEGQHDPCTTNTFCFEFELPGGYLSGGECGRQYGICITLGSKDCCGHPGFIFGTCKGIHITVLPAVVH